MIQQAEFWAAHVKAAGLVATPASEYAKQHGLAVKSLYYWRRKLAATKPALHTKIKPIPTLPGNKFVALQVAAPRQTHCTLSLPSGLRLEMAALPPPEWMTALLHSAAGLR